MSILGRVGRSTVAQTSEMSEDDAQPLHRGTGGSTYIVLFEIP